jgi:hypothetical protein
MKKSITIIALLAGAVGAYAQGTIELGDYGSVGGFTMDIFAPQTPTSSTQTYGQSSFDSPSGTTVYTGAALGGGTGPVSSTDYANGSLWTVAFYAAPGINNTTGLAAAEAAGTPFATSLFQTSGGVSGTGNTGVQGNDSAGVWALNLTPPGTATTVGNNFSGGATIQLEAWYNGGVASPANFATQFAGSPVFGVSEIENMSALGNEGSGDSITFIGGLAGGGTGVASGVAGGPNNGGPITSFSLETTPEPSTIALGVLGASAFLFRRRK